MRRTLFITILLLAAVLLAGCNSGISSDAAAKAFIGAVYSGNAQGARDVLCNNAKSLITDDSVSAFSQTRIDVSGLSYSVRDATDTTANVLVSGNVKLPSGETVDFATVGGGLTTLPAVVEDKAWKICPSGLSF